MTPKRTVAGLSQEHRTWLEDTVKNALPNADAGARSGFISEAERAVTNYRRRCIEEKPLTTAELRRTIKKMREAVALLDSHLPGEHVEVFALVWGAYKGRSRADNLLAFTVALPKVNAALAEVEAGIRGRQPRRSGPVDGLVFEIAHAFASAFNVAPKSTRGGPFDEIASVVVAIATGNEDRESGHRRLLKIVNDYGKMMEIVGDTLDPPPEAQWGD